MKSRLLSGCGPDETAAGTTDIKRANSRQTDSRRARCLSLDSSGYAGHMEARGAPSHAVPRPETLI